MSHTIRRGLLALAGLAVAASPASAQSQPAVHATPPARTSPTATPSGYDLFEAIATYAASRAADCRKKNDPIAAAGWDRIHSAYRVTDAKEKTALQTQTQSQAICDLTSRFARVKPDDADPAAWSISTWQMIFLSELFLEHARAKDTDRWLVGREKLEKLHRNVCSALATYTSPQPGVSTVPPIHPYAPSAVTPGSNLPPPSALPVALTPGTVARHQPMAAPVPREWESLTCAEGGFTIDTPKDLKVSADNWVVDGRSRPDLGATFACAPADGVTYQVAYYVLDAETPKWGEAKTREYLGKYVRDLGGGGKAVCELPRWFGPNFGLDALYEGPKSATRVRAFVIGRRLYFVRVIGPDQKAVSTPDAWRFFHSMSVNRTSRDLSDCTEPASLLTFRERYPGLAASNDSLPQSTRGLMDFLNNSIGQLDREILLKYNPTTYAYTTQEVTDMFFAHLSEVEAEINDPKTPADRRVRLQRYLESRLALFSQANMAADGIRASVLKAQRDLAARNARWELRRNADAESIYQEGVRQAAEEALWRAENDFPHR